jgi:F0F1-type ATP synthase gamma subunit
VDPAAHPLLQSRPHPKNCLVLVITSDKGLCGGFNNNLIKFIHRWLHQPAQGQKADRRELLRPPRLAVLPQPRRWPSTTRA